ncbi:MAG: hypothetical protein IJE43_10380 [Alphaproteobacteria bacterium]|nr:hypothetical protein [Alphaproteobacteria bacterium]
MIVLRRISLVMLLVMTMLLSACGIKGKPVVYIESYEWKMMSVMSNNTDLSEDELVIAVGEQDDIHPNAKIVDLKLVAKDGSITITDATNNKTYSGTYKVQQKTPKGTDYEVTIDGIKGYATVAPTEYYDGSEVPTLPINLGEYSLYFTPVE